MSSGKFQPCKHSLPVLVQDLDPALPSLPPPPPTFMEGQARVNQPSSLQQAPESPGLGNLCFLGTRVKTSFRRKWPPRGLEPCFLLLIEIRPNSQDCFSLKGALKCWDERYLIEYKVQCKLSWNGRVSTESLPPS